MGITRDQIRAAQVVQHAAAHDGRERVRLVAGPGTGKSSSIEERVAWLLRSGVPPEAVWVISFTRASARDLRDRVRGYCVTEGFDGIDDLRITTLHSLALRTLRRAGLLRYYPTDPHVLDDWELERIFDAEFGQRHKIGKGRREDIRLEHEAFWSTGTWGPPNYIPPDPPITAEERNVFTSFHGPRTQVYACVLPGELIRQCVTHINSGTLDPVELLGLQHLIVDEFQDLNPLDLQFVDALAARGVVLFVAGDDDQSIYSFRYASPAGIQQFTDRNPGAGVHTLTHCFRCTPAVVGAAEALITANAGANRLPKRLESLYEHADPPVAGSVYRWRFANDGEEARAIAQTCHDLIQGGMTPRDILILLSKRSVGALLGQEMERLHVPFDPMASEHIHDTDGGRLMLAVLRIVCSRDDYVAHRTLLCLAGGCGVGTCTSICDKVIENNLNFRDLFYNDLPPGVFKGRERNAITSASNVVRQVADWQVDDTLDHRREALVGIVGVNRGDGAGDGCREYIGRLPGAVTLGELCDFVWSDTDEQQAHVLESVYTRLRQPVPDDQVLPQRVRVMTMHSAKGLSARVVFIPGLEEETFPGARRAPYPGLVLEAARLLYVSITRARLTCVVSYARSRRINGSPTRLTPSRFAANLGGPFTDQRGGLTAPQVQQVINDCANL